MTDFAALNLAAKSEGVTYDLELLHPVTDEPTGLFVKLISDQTDVVRKARADQANEMLKKTFEQQRRAKDAKAPTVDDIDRRTAKLLATATVGWFEKVPGKPGEADKIVDGLPFGDSRLLFTPAEAERIYASAGYEWMRKQVDDAVGDLTNFTKG